MPKQTLLKKTFVLQYDKKQQKITHSHRPPQYPTAGEIINNKKYMPEQKHIL